jgi:hypothetical protein
MKCSAANGVVANGDRRGPDRMSRKQSIRPADADMLDGSVLADSLRARRKCLCEHVAKA